MPIPELRQDLPAPARTEMRLVAASPGPRRRSHPLWYPRLIAHWIDVSVILGFGLYAGKIFSLLGISFYMRQIRGTGKAAGGLFLDVLGEGEFGCSLACVGALAIFCLILLPVLTGRTVGLGVLGLKIQGEDHKSPSLHAMGLRFFACLLGYASGGLILLATLRGREGSFLQDRMSRTSVVKQD